MSKYKHILLILLCLTVFNNSQALAEGSGFLDPDEIPHIGDVSKTYCDDGGIHEDEESPIAADALCAFIWFQNTMSTKFEGEFIVRMVKQPEQEIKNFRADLWNENGDNRGFGAPPLTIEDLGDGSFQVTESIFPVPGLWTIQLQYETNDEFKTIIIPFTVGEAEF